MFISSSISNYFLAKIKSSARQQSFINWNDSSEIVIIVFDNHLNHLVNFLENCKKDNISTHVIIISNGKKKIELNYSCHHTVLTDKQFNIWGFLKKDLTVDFKESNFDLLINLGTSTQMKSLSLSKLINAKCKIGRFKHNVFDMIIESEHQLTDITFLEQVIIYLKMIKKN